MDIFRERVFLRSEEHGSRIIPLVQLREEVEARGDVLITAESRSRLAVTAESPAAAAVEDGPTGVDELPLDVDGPLSPAPAATPPSSGAPTPRSSPHRRRRRRHRRDPSDDSPPPA